MSEQAENGWVPGKIQWCVVNTSGEMLVRAQKDQKGRVFKAFRGMLVFNTATTIDEDTILLFR